VYSVIDRQTNGVKWTWACRVLRQKKFNVDTISDTPPVAGDLGLFRVEQIGYHATLLLADSKKLRIWPGDHVVGVFGNRYATDAYEAEVTGTEDLSLLTAGGMVGTVKSRHQKMARPTTVTFVGFLNDDDGCRINVKAATFRRARPREAVRNLFLVIGTAMNSGKTTASTKLVKGLVDQGRRVAGCKLTGSVSNRDQDEMLSAGPLCAADFSDYGFPSTYLCSREELVALFDTMLADVQRQSPEITIMEVADGFLQRETAMLLAEPAVRRAVKGIVVTADCAASALYGVEHLRRLGYPVVAVSGAFTSAPLFVGEFRAHSDVPVASSAGNGSDLARCVAEIVGPR